MKSFLAKIMLFAGIAIIVDAAVGACCRFLIRHTQGGDTGRMEYICHQTSEDLLIFGASRALHHYDPSILEDSLHLTAFNCGNGGNGIILAYGWFQLMRQHHKPKVIIYDVIPAFDMLQSDNMAYLSDLRFYYGELPAVDSIFWAVNERERYKMLLNSYRFNSQLIALTADLMRNRQDIKGFLPMQGEVPYDEIPDWEPPLNVGDPDPLKLHYLEQLAKDCQASGIRLIFAVSPLYRNTQSEAILPLKELCERYQLPLIDHFTDTTFNFEKTYFADRVHLNQTGATAYTQTIIRELRELISR